MTFLSSLHTYYPIENVIIFFLLNIIEGSVFI